MARSKYSTRTINSAGQIVPWLAAEGALAYTPENPPDKDYFFQYGWIMPGVINPKYRNRQHYYFGAYDRRGASLVFDFWNRARAGIVSCVRINMPSVAQTEIEAPGAVYLYELGYGRSPHYVLIQHGSYQFISKEDQPLLDQGYVFVYRGVRGEAIFRWLRFNVTRLAASDQASWTSYSQVQREILSDAVVSFNSIHDAACRTETGHLNDGGNISDHIARRAGLNIDRNNFADDLWSWHRQGFSMNRWVAAQKFGPNFVSFRTPLSNIRWTNFVAGEHEVRILDPNKLELIEASGCRTVLEIPESLAFPHNGAKL